MKHFKLNPLRILKLAQGGLKDDGPIAYHIKPKQDYIKLLRISPFDQIFRTINPFPIPSRTLKNLASISPLTVSDRRDPWRLRTSSSNSTRDSCHPTCTVSARTPTRLSARCSSPARPSQSSLGTSLWGRWATSVYFFHVYWLAINWLIDYSDSMFKFIVGRWTHS